MTKTISDDSKTTSELLARIWQLETMALKAFTVVEWVVGEGKLLPNPHYDAEDLLIEMVPELGVEDSHEACARLDQLLSAPPRSNHT